MNLTKKVILLLFIISYCMPYAYSQPVTPPIGVSEESEDEDDAAYPHWLKFPDGSKTDNADESVSIDTSSGDAPNGADYLVGTANGTLSAEIVVGTTPGGQLGNTWASPTIDDLFLKLGGDTATAGTYDFTGATLTVATPTALTEAVNYQTLLDSTNVLLNYWFSNTTLELLLTESEAALTETPNVTPDTLTNIYFKSSVAETNTPFNIESGAIISVHFDADETSGAGRNEGLTFQLGYVDADGTSNFTQIGTDSDSTAALTTTKTTYSLHIHVVADITVPSGKRLWLKVIATTLSGAGGYPELNVYYDSAKNHLNFGVPGEVLENFVLKSGDTMTGTLNGTAISMSGNIEGATLTEGGNAVPNVTDNLSVFASTSSSQLFGVLSDETGSASGTPLAVFNQNPTIAAMVGTGLFDLGGAVLEIPSDAAPTTDSLGEMAIDTNLITQGMLQVYLTSAIANIVATTDTPGDNEVPTYDSGGGTVQWEAGGAGGGATYREYTLLPHTAGFDPTNPAIVDWVASSGTGLMRFPRAKFDDGENDTQHYTFIMPSDATASADLILDIHWFSDEDVAENVVWGVQISASTPNADTSVLTQDADTVDTITDSADGNGVNAPLKATITIDYANCDGAVAGDEIDFIFYRVGADGSDTHTNEVYLRRLHLKIPRS